MQVQLLEYTNLSQERFLSCKDLFIVTRCRCRCCDDGESEAENACTGDGQCDTFFTFCLRPRGSSGSNCDINSNSACVIRSGVNENDAMSINRTLGAFLGLNNPFNIPGLTNNWNVSCCTYIMVDVLKVM